MNIMYHASVPEHNIKCFQMRLYCECMGCSDADCRGSNAVMHAVHRLTHRSTTAHGVLINVCKCAAGSENRWRRGPKEGGNPTGERGYADNARLWPLTPLCSIIRGHQLIPGNGQRQWTTIPCSFFNTHSHSTTNSPESTEAYLNCFFFFTNPFPSLAPSSPPLLFAVSCLTSPLSSSRYLRS